jgi:pilus assembly protein CpaB
MKEGQDRRVLFGAIGLAAVAALLGFAALRTVGGGDGTAVVDRTDVVVAAGRIEAGQRIEEDMLTVAAIEEDSVIGNALTSTEGLLGATARVALEQGEQVTAAKLGQDGERAGGPIGDIVLHGRRAVTVAVTEEKVFGGLLAPGDHVDVLAVIQVQDGEADVPTAVELVLDAEVLAVADGVLQPGARVDLEGAPIQGETSDGTIATSDDNTDANPEARNVTLSVTREDALKIALAQEEASVWLSIRAPDDPDRAPIPEQTLQ